MKLKGLNAALVAAVVAIAATAGLTAYGKTGSSGKVRHPASVPYPTAEEGYRRIDIVIPYEDKKSQDLIEVEVGLYSKDCNSFAVMAESKKKTVEGWGYDYLVVKSEGRILTHRTNCEELEKPRFIGSTLGAIYDSPGNYPAEAPYTKVLYVPKDFVVKVNFLKVFKTKEL